MKTLLLFSALATAITAQAQITNASFETWNGLGSHTYENEMINSHGVANPEHGQPDGWTYDYITGVSRTTDASAGDYSAILHNWYSYVQAELTYRGTISSYPTNLMGMYKYVDAVQGSTGKGRVIVRSTTGDVIIDQTFNFGTDTSWAYFDQPLTLLQTPVDPADSLILIFDNSDLSCVGQDMTCNLLFLDNLILESGSANIYEQTQSVMHVFPNPASDKLTVLIDPTSFQGVVKWEILDMRGAVIRTGNLDGIAHDLSVNDLTKGTYFLRISDEGERLAYEKISVQ